MEIAVAGPIFTQIIIQGSVGQQYPYYTIWENNIVVILHIYESVAIFLIFCDHKYTESDSCEM